MLYAREISDKINIGQSNKHQSNSDSNTGNAWHFRWIWVQNWNVNLYWFIIMGPYK
jgi:hypothetical protein